MTENLKDQGLCRTCIHASVCMYREKMEKPVIQCEEFSSDGEKCVESASENLASAAANTSNKIEQNDQQAKKYKGLCIDCKHRLNCLLSHSPSGVWHCEEYE